MSITNNTTINPHQLSEINYCPLCNFAKELSTYNDLNIVLYRILGYARKIANADAGTIFLIKTNQLLFSYIQNDSLFQSNKPNKHIYSSASLPLNSNSIAGYVASSKNSLNIKNAYSLKKDLPFSFDSSFDKSTGYLTVSILAIPFINKNNAVIGVIQIINSLKENKPVPFTKKIQKQIENLVYMATNYIEKSRMAEEFILKTIHITALRDPKETINHVNRVSNITAEIYHAWALLNQISNDILIKTKDKIRLAAMLHDVGKMGVPDSILKKAGRLDPDERILLEQHSSLGANLFKNSEMDIDKSAYEIVLHHHQKWDGTGYTGDPNTPVLKGEQIPLNARIVAIADVFDALVFSRCYKTAWSIPKALEILREGAGTYFDPELINIFLNNIEIVTAIIEKYPENE